MATPAQIKDRIVSMTGAVSGITTALDDYPNDNQPFTDAELPAAVTRLYQASATREDYANDMWLVTRSFQVQVVVSKVPDGAIVPDTTTMETVETFLRDIPRYFAQRRTLNNLVQDTQLMSDTGIIRIIRDTQEYWGVVFTLPVVELEVI